MKLRQPNQQEEDLKQEILLQAEADRGQLLLRQPFIGSLIMRMDIIPVCDFRLNTASTDGTNIYLDCVFYSRLDHLERLFLLAHEVWHCVFLHFARRKGRMMERWNLAADLEIQFAMGSEGLKNPCPLHCEKKWEELNAEEIYDLLKRNASRETPIDEHLEKGIPISEPSQGSQGSQSKQNSPKGQNSQAGHKLADTKAFVLDPDYAPFFVPDIIERTRSRVVSSARQLERMQGKLPGSLERLLTELLDPQLRWQELLAQFVTSCYAGKRRWLPPSRRHVFQGLYLPSLRGEKLKAVVAIDTSGSTANDLGQFFAELNSLLTSFGDYELTVIQCDSFIQSVEYFSNMNPCPPDQQWKSKGHGGTDFRPVFHYLEQHPELEHSLLIYFTDGYGDAPKNPPAYPVLWLLCKNSRSLANWGLVVQL